MRNRTLIANLNLTDKGTIRGGTFISCLKAKSKLFYFLYLIGEIPC